MLFSDASGHKVVSTSTADTVGRVHDYVIDPAGPKVAALLLKKAEGDTLRWADITAFGADAVTVESADKITKGGDDLAALLDKRNHLHKKRVLSTTGDELGTVRDIDFDPSSGVVNALVLEKDQIAGTRVIGVGTYAVVVQSETAGAPAGVDASSQGAPKPPPTGEPVAADPAPSANTPAPPDLSQAQRASYPPTA